MRREARLTTVSSVALAKSSISRAGTSSLLTVTPAAWTHSVRSLAIPSFFILLKRRLFTEDSHGKKSLYAKYSDVEVMFQVSSFMPSTTEGHVRPFIHHISLR